MKLVILCVVLLGIAQTALLGAQSEKPTTTKTTTTMRPEAQILKTIVFITINAKVAGQPETLKGTGFLYGVPIPELGPSKSFAYLVTNRHVAAGTEQDEHGSCYNAEILQTFVTLNLKNPVNGTRSENVLLTFNETSHWYFPQDEGIDLAVLPINIPDKYDALLIKPEDLLTDQILKDRQVAPGDKVLTTGFFSGYAGLHGIQPLLREGVLAMLPDGPMLTTTCKLGHVYLADVHVIPGNSGSPIFILPGLGLGSGVTLGGVPTVFGLLGIVSGYMYENSDFTLRASTTWKGSLNANSGISVLVPAQELADLLETPALRNLREETVRRFHQN
jgi:hypothetical protein